MPNITRPSEVFLYVSESKNANQIDLKNVLMTTIGRHLELLKKRWISLPSL
jgi:hypothetical protein